MPVRLPTAALLLTLGALLLAGSAPVAADGGSRSGASAPARRVALGIATPDGRDLGELDRFSAQTGRRPAIWVIWSQWGLPSSQRFPDTAARGLAARGVTPMIWWEPVDPRDRSSGRYARHSNIIAGRHDAYIRQFARESKAFGRPVLLRFAHEANSPYFPWSIHRHGNSAASFVRAWRHVRRIFRSEGARNVEFVWSVAKQRCRGGCNPYTRLYPGDRYVDVVGVSAHNWGSMKRWVPLYRGARRATHLLSRISSRPIMLAESGSNAKGGNKAAWIRHGYRKVYQRLPQIKAIVYLNADVRDVGHPDWRIASPSEALAAYAEVAARPEFSVPHEFAFAR